MRMSMGVSLRCVLLGEMLWSAWEKDWRASEEEDSCSDACGRDGAAVSLEGRRTGKKVQGVLWEATRELGSDGVMAT